MQDDERAGRAGRRPVYIGSVRPSAARAVVVLRDSEMAVLVPVLGVVLIMNYVRTSRRGHDEETAVLAGWASASASHA